VGIDDVPALMDEYDYYEDVYFGRIKDDNLAKRTKIKGIYEYINKLNPPTESALHVPYQFIAQQASIFPPDNNRDERVFMRLEKYGMTKGKTDSIMQKIRLASRWADDNKTRDKKFEVQLSDLNRKAVQELIEAVRPFAGLTDTADNAKNLQSKVFHTARTNGIEPKDFFSLLYRMFLNANRGPRIGNYFLDLGVERAINTLESYLKAD
jgi:lysyl-tRNA synthetase, class I